MIRNSPTLLGYSGKKQLPFYNLHVEHCTKTFLLLLYASFFSQTHLVLKFNLVFIE